MSEEKNDNNAAGTSACASCGSAEIDDIKLNKCIDCDLVRYCSDECKKEHEPTHKEACKKRAAELRDELLFKQPENSHLGDCPICCLPMPLDTTNKNLMCCSKVICKGCNYANQVREAVGKLQRKCVFCRAAIPSSKEEVDKYRMKRIEANDPVAMHREGSSEGKKGNYIKAFEYFTKAVELGDVEAHYQLSIMYNYEHGVEKDMGAVIHHTEEAAIGGHPYARHNLGIIEWNNGDSERAVKHWIIAASQGHDLSIKALLNAFKRGMIIKDELAAALRTHQAAVDATRSPQRERAAEYHQTERNFVFSL